MSNNNKRQCHLCGHLIKHLLSGLALPIHFACSCLEHLGLWVSNKFISWAPCVTLGAHRLNGWACFWPPCLTCSWLPSFTCEAPCGFVLQSCLLGLQNAYLLPQPLGQIVLLLGKWVKLIGSRRCVLSAGDPGHRFYIICGGLLTSSPPFMALSLHEGHSVQNEASYFISPSWNLVSNLSIFGDSSLFCWTVQGISSTPRHTSAIWNLTLAVGYGHSVLHTAFLCWGSPISFPIQGNQPL